MIVEKRLKSISMLFLYKSYEPSPNSRMPNFCSRISTVFDVGRPALLPDRVCKYLVVDSENSRFNVVGGDKFNTVSIAVGNIKVGSPKTVWEFAKKSGISVPLELTMPESNVKTPLKLIGAKLSS